MTLTEAISQAERMLADTERLYSAAAYREVIAALLLHAKLADFYIGVDYAQDHDPPRPS